MRKYIIIGYYTQDELYKNHAKELIESIQCVGNLVYDIQEVPSQGDWYKNTQFKPRFIKQMLEKHWNSDLVYVDVDARFLAQPTYFNILAMLDDVTIAAHILDHKKYARPHQGFELLSGTLYIRNSQKTREIINKWINEMVDKPTQWDQRALAKILQGSGFYVLPEEYCVIFDYMSTVQNKIICHYQASRICKKQQQLRQQKIIRIRHAL